MDNPKATVDALLENKADIGDITVYELTIARFALCELVKCPFVSGEITQSISDYVDTFYIMCNDVNKLAKYNSKNVDELHKDALVWADTLDFEKVPAIFEAILKKFKLLNVVAPDSAEKKS